MPTEMRPIELGEWEEFLRAAEGSFSSHVAAEDIEDARADFEIDRSLAVFENGHIVGTAAAYSLSMTVPGPEQLAVAGVTMVGVLPTHRRRGHLTSLMRRQLDDIRERGEAMAILLASESAIYGRFGYGIATTQTELQIDPRLGRFAHSPEMGGQVELVSADQARKVVPEIFERARRR